MKTLLSLILLSLCLITSAFSLGCKSANTAAYKTTAAVHVTVDAAMSAWGDYVAKHQPPADEELAVKDAYQKYQAAASAVAAAGLAHARVVNDPAQEPGALGNLKAAVAISGDALADLVALIHRFGVDL